jgi:hypothetical protein
MCHTADETLYTNRFNSSIIVATSYGCGAWDSDMPEYIYYEKRPLLGFFYLKTKVDTSHLNKSIWIEK